MFNGGREVINLMPNIWAKALIMILLCFAFHMTAFANENITVQEAVEIAEDKFGYDLSDFTVSVFINCVPKSAFGRTAEETYERLKAETTNGHEYVTVEFFHQAISFGFTNYYVIDLNTGEVLKEGGR